MSVRKQHHDAYARARVTPGQATVARDPEEWVRRQLDRVVDEARRADFLEAYLDKQQATQQPFTREWWATLKQVNRVRTHRLTLGEGAIAGPFSYPVPR